MLEAAGGLLAVALRFVAYTAMTGALGAWLFEALVLPRLVNPADVAWTARVRRVARAVAMTATGLLAVSSAARLLGCAGGAPCVRDDLGVPPGAPVLANALVVQVMAAVVAFVALTVRRHTEWPRLATVGIVAFALASPFQAHAGIAPDFRWLSVAVDCVHVMAAGGWVGALALLTAVAWQQRAASEGPTRVAALFVAFHPIALVAAPTVFATGLLTAWLRMGAPEGIANSTYSGLFVAKLLLAGVVGFFGAGHSKLAIKRVPTVAPDAVSRTLAAEVAFAVVVLLVTAVLVGTPPIG